MTLALQRRALLVSAASLVPGLSFPAPGDTVSVGQIGPFTGMPAPEARELHEGITAAIAQVNAAGGINGRRLDLFALDDGYQADGFVQRFDEAMKQKPVALLAPVGTRAIQRLLDDRLLDRSDVVVLDAVPGADSLRQPGHARLFHIRAGDAQQVARIVSHAVTLGHRKLTVLYQDVPVGRSGFDAAGKAARVLEVTLSPVRLDGATTEPDDAAVRPAVDLAQATLVLGSPRVSALAIAALRRAGLVQTVYALSYLPPALLTQVAKADARGVALAQVFPNPNGRKLMLQHEFQSAMKGTMPNAPADGWTALQMEGYVTARVLAEGLRRAGVPSGASLARALRAMGDRDLGGFHVNFSRDNIGSRFVDIAVVNEHGRLTY